MTPTDPEPRIDLGGVRHGWFVPWNVTRPASGSPIRSYHLMRDLAAGPGFTVLMPIEETGVASPYPPLEDLDVREYPRGRFSRLRGRLILNPASRSARGPTLHALVRQLGDSGQVTPRSWLVCDSAYLAAPLLQLATDTGAQLVYSSHNCETSVWRQLLASSRGQSNRLGPWLAFSEIRSQERSLARAARAVWCCSERDADLMVRLAPEVAGKTIVAANGVNGSVVRLQPTDRIAPSHFCHIGYLETGVAHEACVFLIREVLPRVRSALPGVTLTLAGRDARPALRAMAGDGVEVVSPFGDPNTLLGRARLSVGPLLQGGGTRLKILESLAAGRPVVSTTKGAEGLDLGSLAGVTVADGPAALADAIVAELRAPRVAGRAEELRARVLSGHEWTTITSRLLETMGQRFGSPWR
jgi:glycosyltransferase involved in cell wall biosynthesis